MQTLTRIKEWLFGKKVEKCSGCDDTPAGACHAHYAQMVIDKGTNTFGDNLTLTPALEEVIRESGTQEEFYAGLMARLQTKGYRVHQFTPYQFRINGFMDVYPVNRKWHNIRTGERGTYQDVFVFVREA